MLVTPSLKNVVCSKASSFGGGFVILNSDVRISQPGYTQNINNIQFLK